MSQLETTTDNQIPAMSLEERRDTLSYRLDTGFDKIEQALRAGQDTSRWESAWMRLLKEYEEVCDQISRRPSPATH